LPDGARHGKLRERCKEIRNRDQKRSHHRKGIRQADSKEKKRMKEKNEREEREKWMKKRIGRKEK
jgi:hypothetical protein